MELKLYKTKKEFCDENLLLLEKEEALNNIMIAVIMDAEENDVKDWVLARIEDKGLVQMIIIINKPRNGLLMYSPTNNCSDEICKYIAYKIKELKFNLLEINSRKELCEKVANYYIEITNKKIKCKKDKYILQLTKLNENLDLHNLEMIQIKDDCEEISKICDNIVEFQEDAHNEIITHEDAKSHADIHIRKGLYLFKNSENEIVMQAITCRKLINGYVIGAVITPKAHRGNGYAKTGMYILSKKLLDDGAKVLALYTNAKNTISNHVYEKVGYERISEELLIEFED